MLYMQISKPRHLLWFSRIVRYLLTRNPASRFWNRILHFFTSLWSLLKRKQLGQRDCSKPWPPSDADVQSICNDRGAICASAEPVYKLADIRTSPSGGCALGISGENDFNPEPSAPPGDRSQIHSTNPEQTSLSHESLTDRIPYAIGSDLPMSTIQNQPTFPPYAKPLIEPISASAFKRYQRNIVMPNDETQCLVPPATRDFKFNDELSDWTSIIHPEGAPYFFHKKKNIFTDAWIVDPVNLADINYASEVLFSRITDFIPSSNINSGHVLDIELVLDLTQSDDGNTKCGYYFVDHSSRSLFWLDEFDARSICKIPIVSLSHLGYEIEAQYWKHWELFPNNRILSDDILEEVREILQHSIGATLTSNSSTASYDTDQLNNFLNLINSIRPITSPRHGHTVWVVARLMSILVNNQFLNFHGQPGARLNLHQSVYGKNRKPRSRLMHLLSLLLFSAPDVHLQALDRIWVDYIAKINLWEDFIRKLNTEWQEFVIIDTVLLNANVAFLAIQSVDNVTNTRSTAQIASYISIMSSLGSVITALVLIRQHRTKNIRDASQVIFHFSIGTERLAIVYSLPYVLLMWSVLSFLVAFLSICFTFSNTVTRGIVGSFVGLLGVLVLQCILTTRETREGDAMATFEGINESIDRTRGWSHWYRVFVQQTIPKSPFGRNGMED